MKWMFTREAMNFICWKALFRGKPKLLRKEEIQPTAEDQVGNGNMWEGRVLAGILVLLVFPLNYIFIVVVLANYTAWARAFDSAI